MDLQPSEWALLSGLMDEAEALPLSERERWLSRLPSEHAHLAGALRTLLARASSGTAQSPLDRAPYLPPADESALQPAMRVGPYRLKRPLGKGGMGEVWLAERADGTFEREVALKLPRHDWDSSLFDRMRQEIQIAASLEHPGIARLYEAGLDAGGRPFIAMQFIDGQPIDARCREHRPDIPTRLRLFVQVARAVAYAHAQHVVHRDIKPSNLLVTPEAHVHLLDFGIARHSGDDGQPSASDATDPASPRTLTPRYASPEQLRGEAASVRSDVYSLGVLLYELLAGQGPWSDDVAGRDARLQRLQAGSPPAASQRCADPATARHLRGALDAILSHALQHDPLQRYASAEAMAADIERHLRGEPVSVLAEGRWKVGARWVQRHRSALAAGLAAAGVGLAGLTVVLNARQHAASEAERARLATAFVSEMFRLNLQAPTRENTPAGERSADFLDATTQLIESRFAHQPELQAELFGAISRTHVDIGDGAAALRAARRQMDLLGSTSPPSLALGRAKLVLAEALREEGKEAEATVQAREAVQLLDSHPEPSLSAKALLAELLFRTGQAAEARQWLQTAEQAWPRLEDAPGLGGAQMLHVKARLLNLDNQVDDSLAVLDRAVTRARAVDGAQSRDAHRWLYWRMLSLMNRNRPDEAKLAFEDLTRSLQACGDAGRIRAAHATALYAFRVAEMTDTPFDEVRALFARVDLALAEFGPNVPAHVRGKVELYRAASLLFRGELREGEAPLARATAILQSSTERSEDLLQLAMIAGYHAMKSGHHAEADRWLRQRLALRQRSGQGHIPSAVYDWIFISRNLLMGGDAQGALEFLADAPDYQADGADKTFGWAYAMALGEARAMAHLERGDTAAAATELARYRAPASEDPSNNTEFDSWTVRGELWCASGRGREGLQRLVTAVRAVPQHMLDREPSLNRTRALAGLCALGLGDRPLALEMLQAARKGFAAQPTVSAWYRRPLQRLERALPHA